MRSNFEQPNFVNREKEIEKKLQNKCNEILEKIDKGKFDVSDLRNLLLKHHEQIALKLVEVGEISKLIANIKNFDSLNQEVVLKLLEEGYTSLVASNLYLCQELSQEIVIKLLEKGRGQQVSCFIDRGKNLNNEIALKLIEARQYESVIENLDSFTNLSYDVALKLIELGCGHDVIKNFDKFDGMNRKEVAYCLIKQGQYDWVVNNFSKFEGVDYKQASLIFIEAKKKDYGEYLVENLDTFEGLDKNEVALKLIKNGHFMSVISNLDKFEGLNHKEIASKIIENGGGEYIAKYLDKFEGLNHKEIASKIIENGGGKYVVNYLEKFEGLNYKEIGLKIIEAGGGESIAWSIRNMRQFRDLDHNDIQELAFRAIAKEPENAVNFIFYFSISFDQVKKYLEKNSLDQKIIDIIFIHMAQKKDWNERFGGDKIKELLDVLPKQEKRNAFTRNEYDRASAFFVYLQRELGSDLEFDSLDIFVEYIKEFNLSKTAILFRYFQNIKLLEAGKIKELPQEQIEQGLTSIEQLVLRYKKFQAMAYSESPEINIGNWSEFEKDLLSSVTGYSMHSFIKKRPRLEQLLNDFKVRVESHEISEMPKEYYANDVKVGNVDIEFDKEKIKPDFDVISQELLKVVKETDLLKEQSQTVHNFIDEQVAGLQSRLSRTQNKFIEKQLKQFNEMQEKIKEVKSADDLMKILLSLDRKTIEKNNLTTVLQQIILQKIFEKNYSPEMILGLVTEIEEGVSGKSVLALINLVDNIVKDHVLNMEKDNDEEYWSKSCWQEIKKSKKDSKRIDLLKIFNPQINNLREAAEKFKVVQKKGSNYNVEMIPDKSLIGEMSGYLANACYTAVYPLLSRYPNLVPFKFVSYEDGDDNPKLFGSVLIFELETEKGEKAMLIRAFNVPNEGSIDVGKFFEKFVSHLSGIAKERGVEKILMPGLDGAISNYHILLNYLNNNYKKGKNSISLSEKFTFNSYDITNDCYVVRDLKKDN